MDLDHFKAYNDTHGHPAGDTLLAQTATAWQRLLRAGDTLARLGGEEFAVLLPNCTSSDAARLADTLLRAMPHAQTSSAGITQWAGDTADTLLARADAALYHAKHSGRNRTHTATTGGTGGGGGGGGGTGISANADSAQAGASTPPGLNNAGGDRPTRLYVPPRSA